MGDRAVITSWDVNKSNMNKKIGIYLHWSGYEEKVKHFLALAKQKEIRGCDTDPQYCWARLVQIIGDEFSKTGNNDLSLGIGIVSNLDCHNYDNGVYYIDNEFNIVDHTDGSELE